MKRKKRKAQPTPMLADGLKNRLEELIQRVEEARAVVNEIEDEKGLVEKLLELEMRRAGKTGRDRQREIREIVRAELFGGKATKSGMRKAAIDEGHASPGRAIHAVLMNLIRHGYATTADGEHHFLTDKGRDALNREVEGVS